MRAAPSVVVASGANWYDGVSTRSWSSTGTNFSTTSVLQVDIGTTVNTIAVGASVIFLAGSGDVSASAEL
jgi:hypothetical protein